MHANNLMDKISLVFGQMGSNPVARSKAVDTGLTIAEYLRDEKKSDALVFIDNIYRYIQAESEISMELKEILVGIEGLKAKGDLDKEIQGIEKNSNNIKEGYMFVAIK